MWCSYLEYKILWNECKEWKTVFLHENRPLTNLLSQEIWKIIYKIDKLYLELSWYIFLPVSILRKHIGKKKKMIPVVRIFSQVCYTVLSVNLQLTTVRMELAFKWGQSPNENT